MSELNVEECRKSSELKNDWKNLISAALLETDIPKEPAGTSKFDASNPNPILVMNERHKLVGQNSKERFQKTYPRERKLTDARKLLREEQLENLIRAKENRIVKKAIDELEQWFSSRCSQHAQNTDNQMRKRMVKKSKESHMKREIACHSFSQYYNKISVIVNSKKNHSRSVIQMQEHIVKLVVSRSEENAKTNSVVTDCLNSRDKGKNKCLPDFCPQTDTDLVDCEKTAEEVLGKTESNREVKCTSPANQVTVLANFEITCINYYWRLWREFVLVSKKEKSKLERQNKIDSFMTRLMKSEVKKAKVKNEVRRPERPKKVKRITKVRRNAGKVEDSKLERISVEIGKSQSERYETLRKGLKSFHPKLRPKVRALTVLSAAKGDQVDRIERKWQPIPKILIRIENMNKERKKRWEELQKKKREIQEEKAKIEREDMEARKRLEELNRKRAFEELRKRKRQEEERKKILRQERQDANRKMVVAKEHHRKYLLSVLAFEPWKRVVEERRRRDAEADAFWRLSLFKKCFTKWNEYARARIAAKCKKAEELHARTIMKKTLMLWISEREESVKCWQTAVDWEEAKLTERVFNAWLSDIRKERREITRKLDLALNAYQRTLKKNCLKKWVAFPEVRRLEREKEFRKQKLRQKVLELLPDFRSLQPLQHGLKRELPFDWCSG